MSQSGPTYNRLHVSEVEENGSSNSHSYSPTKPPGVDNSAHSQDLGPSSHNQQLLLAANDGISLQGKDVNHGNRQSEEEEERARGADIFSCYINLTCTILGSGILGIPYAVSDVGWIAGLALILVCGLLGGFTLHILAASALGGVSFPS